VSDKKPKAAWDDEPTPRIDLELRANGSYVQGSPGKLEKFMPPEVPRDLERKLRHAARLLGTIRIDCVLDGPDGTLDPDLLEQRLGDLEEVLTP
jgi:hypothetical protein